MFRRLAEYLRRFMWGRYGSDQLNIFLIVAAVVLSLVGSILSGFNAVCALIGGLVMLLAYALLILCVFRMLSRKLDHRRRENQRFLNLTAAVRDRQNRYYRCPKCKQTVRVPRGRGKICIKCPKCGEKFIRKS